MKKFIFIILLFLNGSFLFAVDGNIPERPSNIPEDAEWYNRGAGFWRFFFQNEMPVISWHRNGSLHWLYYYISDNKYTINESYYPNGNIKDIEQSFNLEYLESIFKNKEMDPHNRSLAGKQLKFYENGKLKEERSYTPAIQKNGKVKCVLCGPEIFYNENGEETKRIEHDEKCKYGHSDIPRQSVDQLIALIKPYKDRARHDRLTRLPVIGKIVSTGSWLKRIEIEYYPGFELTTGDQACCVIDDRLVSFECIDNEKGIGKFNLIEDKYKKYPMISKETEPRFYKKNEIKYTDYLKSGGKPSAGDIKVIAGIEFVYIPAGEGINAFWITKYEVTLGEYLKYNYEKNHGLPENMEKFTLGSKYPAVLGRFSGRADNYCDWFGIKHGVKSVLPELDEWEYAARAGTTTDYYWGNENAGDYAWYKKNSGGKLHTVGEKKPNAFGLFDMIGNAGEWCQPYYLIGGSYRSNESNLKYGVVYDMYTELTDNPLYTGSKEITNLGVGFRMIIRVPK